MQADEAAVRERVSVRYEAGFDASDADLRVLEHQLRTCEPLGADELGCAVVVDTTESDGSVQRAVAVLAAPDHRG